MPVDYDPYSHRWQRDPYAKYRELRDEAPVHFAAESGAYTVSRYEDVRRVLETPEVFSSRMDRRRQGFRSELPLMEKLRAGLRFFRAMKTAPWTMARARMLIQADGETHAVMRKLVNRGFTPRQVRSWEPRVRELAADGLARLRAKPTFDLVQELAIPLPVTVIAELLGVEAEQRQTFKRWSDQIIEGGTGSGVTMGQGAALEATSGLSEYLRPIVRERRARPASDLISVLVSAEGEAALNDFEIFLFVLLLLVAGNETTTNLLGNATDALLAHPSVLERVAGDLSLVPGLIEETLRFDGPVQFVTRTCMSDTELRGVQIPEGAHVVVLLGSANRDERRFEDPDRFDPERDTRGHVGFGFGAHFCLGASLARLEARAALDVLVPELPRLARGDGEPDFLDSYQIRGRARLPLKLAA